MLTPDYLNLDWISKVVELIWIDYEENVFMGFYKNALTVVFAEPAWTPPGLAYYSESPGNAAFANQQK